MCQKITKFQKNVFKFSNSYLLKNFFTENKFYQKKVMHLQLICMKLFNQFDLIFFLF